MKKSWLMGLVFTSVLVIFVHNSAAAVRLESKVIDDATGQALAARIALTTPEGKFIEIEGRHEHVQYLGKRWCYVDGSFAANIPDSGATVEIRRGFETRPLVQTISVKGAGRTIQKTFRLHRWIDMRLKGYVNGDIHAHLPVPKEAHVQMRAEDLNTQVLYHMADSQSSIATNERFTGTLDACSSPGGGPFPKRRLKPWI